MAWGYTRGLFYMKLLLFGTGDYYNRYKKWFMYQDVLALLDNSVQKQYTFIDGLKVLPPIEGIRLPYDKIIILSFYVEQMKKQLISMGVKESKIYHFYDLHELLAKDREVLPIHYFLNAKEVVEEKRMSEPKLLLMSNELSLGGPPIALFHAALILKKQGYKIVFASMMDGPLRQQIIENGIPVVVDENLQVAVMKEALWISTFSLLICNTLNFHVFLSERDIKIPVIWWLHDARFFYEGVNRRLIGEINLDNLKAVSVGPIPAKAVNEFLPDMECEELLYGVADIKDKFMVCPKSQTIHFITIGFLEDIKGQDILIEAIKQLPAYIRKQCEFCLVGHERTLFGEIVQRKSAEIREIMFTGSVSRENIHKLLSTSDVLICPSRQDSMPTVVAEAMMHSIPCIVSDAVGTAAYIHDGKDGMIFQSENVQELTRKIERCVIDRDKLKSMGKEARRLYEIYFSITVFEEKLLGIIKKILKDNGFPCHQME